MTSEATLFLVAHRNPRHGNPSPRELRALGEIGRRLRRQPITHAAHATCAAAQVTLRHILDGARLPTDMMRPVEEGLSAEREMPCCDDPELRELLKRVPAKVRPSAAVLLGINARVAAMIGARANWRMSEWLRHHQLRGSALMVVHPLTLELAMWSTTHSVCRDFQRDPRLFRYTVEASRRTVHFPPGGVLHIPYRHRMP